MTDMRAGMGTEVRRVYLHVGTPKSGTTHLQRRLRRNAETLRAHGVGIPRNPRRARGIDASFRAALDLTGQDFGGPPGHARGAWARAVRQSRRQRVTVISHELLATADADVIRRARADLADAELHVVVTARDPARALPAAWQESVKQGRRLTYRQFLDRAREGEVWLARAMDVDAVLESWGADLPADRLHLVTLPRPGADRDLLWQRFCDALGIDPDSGPLPADRSNESLGIAETQLLRRVNRRHGRRNPEAHRLLKYVVAEGALSLRDSMPILLPPEDHAWVAELAERWIGWVRERGVPVSGDLDDLRPRPTQGEWRDPDEPVPAEVAGAAVDALAATIAEVSRPPVPDRPMVRLRAGVHARWRSLRRR
ncbi:hypothetical protein [Nocardioides terrisoli]|uniref:hypothetical protein n=1 Tax=Nocardioides terrisoli TaxID=3388267 RepID=UPI00287B5D58|nr:hypothetical protein [Nocardioides marmorisolisilvae]